MVLLFVRLGRFVSCDLCRFDPDEPVEEKKAVPSAEIGSQSNEKEQQKEKEKETENRAQEAAGSAALTADIPVSHAISLECGCLNLPEMKTGRVPSPLIALFSTSKVPFVLSCGFTYFSVGAPVCSRFFFRSSFSS